MLYHGTDTENLNLNLDIVASNKNLYGQGFYTSDNPNDCTQHGSFIYEVHLPYLADCYPVWDQALENHFSLLKYLRSFSDELADQIDEEYAMYGEEWTLKNWYEFLEGSKIFPSLYELGKFFEHCNILGSQFTSGYYAGTCYCTFLPENVKIRGIADLETVLGYLE